MCKTTIEKAASKVDGVEEANWGINSKILNIKFKENLDNRDDIVKKIESWQEVTLCYGFSSISL